MTQERRRVNPSDVDAVLTPAEKDSYDDVNRNKDEFYKTMANLKSKYTKSKVAVDNPEDEIDDKFLYGEAKKAKLSEAISDNAKVGDTIKIISMKGEPKYSGKVGKVKYIDGIGQLHGTWGGLAIIPGEDSFRIIEKAEAVISDRDLSKCAWCEEDSLTEDLIDTKFGKLCPTCFSAIMSNKGNTNYLEEGKKRRRNKDHELPSSLITPILPDKAGGIDHFNSISMPAASSGGDGAGMAMAEDFDENTRNDYVNKISFLSNDEVEAVEGYDEAILFFNNSSLANKDQIIDTLNHIKEEELEHLDELKAINSLLNEPDMPQEVEDDEYDLNSLED